VCRARLGFTAGDAGPPLDKLPERGSTLPLISRLPRLSAGACSGRNKDGGSAPTPTKEGAMSEDIRGRSARAFTAAVLKTVREVHQHTSPEDFPQFVRDVATFLHATGTRWSLPSFVAAADALCASYGEDGRQRSPHFRLPEQVQ
jgi:hypothetical protein